MNNYKPYKENKTLIESIKKDFNNFLKKIYWYPSTKIQYFKRTYFQKIRDESNLISILTISKNRSERLSRVLEKIKINTFNKKKIEVLIFIDHDENQKNEYEVLVNLYKKDININLYTDNIKNNTEKHNYLAKISKGDLIFLVTDDMYLEKNWDTSINKEANKFKKNESFCIWPKEIGLKYPYLHCNAPIISRKWFVSCGYYLHYNLFHYYADNWICDLCRSSGKFLITKNYIWKHEHPDTIPELIDNTYLNIKKRSKDSKEHEIYKNLQKTKKITVKKILEKVIY